MVGEAKNGSHGLYVPAGAFWGGHDVQKMADRGTLKVRLSTTCTPYGVVQKTSFSLSLSPQLQSLKVTMKKHPSAFKLTGYLAKVLTTVEGTSLTLYEGTERGEREPNMFIISFPRVAILRSSTGPLSFSS